MHSAPCWTELSMGHHNFVFCLSLNCTSKLSCLVPHRAMVMQRSLLRTAERARSRMSCTSPWVVLGWSVSGLKVTTWAGHMLSLWR